jgi:zinc protease
MRGLLAFVLGLFASAVLADQAIHEFRLDNGLKLIVKEDHRAPVMVSQVWYKVGSSYEHDGITGVSHVLEHMMFKGTEKHPAGEFSRIIADNGGEENAFTSQDYTAYFQTMEKSRLPVSFEMEADRMRNLALPEDEFMKEVQVVMEERRMRTEDNPQSLTYERFNATAFTSSPYRIPVIGWMDDLESLRIDDLKSWYQQWYAPNNATVVVVGDVDPDAVYALAQRYFGPLKPSEIRPVKPRQEVAQLGSKRIKVKAPAELPYLIMGYKVPVVLSTAPELSWEPFALEVLAGVLDGGTSARLESELVRGQALATSVGAGYDAYDRLQTLFVFSGTPSSGKSVVDLEKGLRQQLKRLRETPVNRQELDRVKAKIRADKVYEQDSIFYQAMQIGIMETIGLSWKELDRYYEHLDAVTPEQVQAVARKYLTDDRLTVAELVPQPLDPNHPPKSGGGDDVH